MLLATFGSALYQEIESTADQSKHQKLVEAIASITDTLSRLNSVSRKDNVHVLFDIIYNENSSYRQGFLDFVKKVGIQSIFPKAQTQEQLEGDIKELSDKVQWEFRRIPIFMHEVDRWRELLAITDQLEIPLKDIDTRPIYKDISQDLSELARRDHTVINFPRIEYPASYLLSRMTSSPTAKAYWVAQLFCEYGIFDQGRIRMLWPKRKEKEVAQVLWESTRFKPTEYGLKLVCAEKIPRGMHPEIEVGEVFTLAKNICGKDQRLHAMLHFNRYQKGAAPHWAEMPFREFEKQFPELMARHRVDNKSRFELFRGIAKDLYDGVTPDEAYRGLLWFAAHKGSGDLAPRLDRIIQDCQALGEHRSDAQDKLAFLPTKVSFKEPDQISPTLQTLSPRAKVATALACSILSDTTRSPTVKRHQSSNKNRKGVKNYGEQGLATQALSSFFDSGLSISKRLHGIVQTPLPPVREPSMRHVWRALFSEAPSQSINMEPILKVAATRADYLRRTLKDPLPQYLFSRTGRVLVHTHGGDFRDLRQYVPGDDFKRIAWRTSAKGNDLYVRLSEDEESRKLTLVYDLRYLSKNIHRWNSHIKKATEEAAQDKKKQLSFNPEKYAPEHLKDLFMILELAAHENISVDLTFIGRSYVGSIEDVVERNVRAAHGIYNREAVAKEINSYVQSATDLRKAENAVYGPSGFAPVNIFGENDLQSRHDSIYVFALSEKNRDLSKGILSNLQAQGKLGASLRESSRRGVR